MNANNGEAPNTERDMQRNLQLQAAGSQFGNDSFVEFLARRPGEGGQVKAFQRQFGFVDGVPESVAVSVRHLADCGHVINDTAVIQRCRHGCVVCKECITECERCKRNVCKNHLKLFGGVYCRSCLALIVLCSPFWLVFHMVATVLFGLFGKRYGQKEEQLPEEMPRKKPQKWPKEAPKEGTRGAPRSFIAQKRPDNAVREQIDPPEVEYILKYLEMEAVVAHVHKSEWYLSEVRTLREKFDLSRAVSLNNRLLRIIEKHKSGEGAGNAQVGE